MKSLVTTSTIFATRTPTTAENSLAKRHTENQLWRRGYSGCPGTKGEFEPELVREAANNARGDIEKNRNRVCQGHDHRRHRRPHQEEIYGLDVSDSTISRITDKNPPRGQNGGRACCRLYAVVWTRSISMCEPRGRSSRSRLHRHRAGHGRPARRAGHVHQRRKRKREVLADGAEQPATEVDILIVSVGGLTGFPDASSGIPPARIQKCVIHQIRNTTRLCSTRISSR